MKTKLLFKFTASLALAVLAFTAQAANVQGAVFGDTDTITVGKTTTTIGDGVFPVPSVPEKPGIGHADLGGELISFEALQALGSTTDTGGAPGWQATTITPDDIPPGKPNLGYFDFVQAGTEAVFFGEWSQTGAADDSTHSVYYAGEAGNVVDTLPTQTATYTVVGINQGNALNGTLTATFGGENMLEGSLFSSAMTLDIMAPIEPTDASFSGIAFANIGNGLVAGGSQGHFFGDAAAALAGLATFADSALNTAFGGNKNP